MEKKVEKSRTRKIILITAVICFSSFLVLSLLLSWFDGIEIGNVALISLSGVITADGDDYLGQETISSKTITKFLEEAEKKDSIKAVLLEVNSGGGSVVATDEIATQLKKMKKPVVALIREVGASGAYWIASACDYIIANRMSITGSIGVISSYLEFSQLMKKYGVGYERLVAGDKKDMGSSFKQLTSEEKKVWQLKLDKIHDFFIKEIAQNRNLKEEKVQALATGEFFLGLEAKELGLIDEVGDKFTAEEYLKEKTGLKEISYQEYKTEKGLIESLLGAVSSYFFKIGEGIGAVFVREGNKAVWI